MSTKLGWLQTGILLILKKNPTYGYNLMKELRGGEERVSPGTRYPALSKLQAMGLVDFTTKSGSAAKRKIYHLTEKGLTQLAQTEKLFFESISGQIDEDIVNSTIDWLDKYLDIQEGSSIIFSCIDSVEIYDLLRRSVGDTGNIYVIPRIDVYEKCESVKMISEDDIDNLNNIDYAIFSGISPMVPDTKDLKNLYGKLNNVLSKNGKFIFTILDTKNMVLRAMLNTVMPIKVQQPYTEEYIESILSEYFTFEKIYDQGYVTYMCQHSN